jgi:hypothetical protein
MFAEQAKWTGGGQLLSILGKPGGADGPLAE